MLAVNSLGTLNDGLPSSLNLCHRQDSLHILDSQLRQTRSVPAAAE
jgi:hypothetical protein